MSISALLATLTLIGIEQMIPFWIVQSQFWFKNTFYQRADVDVDLCIKMQRTG